MAVTRNEAVGDEKTQYMELEFHASTLPVTVTMVPPDTGPALGVTRTTEARAFTVIAAPEALQSRPLLLTLTNMVPGIQRVGSKQIARPLSTHLARTLVWPSFSEHAKSFDFANRLPVTVTRVASAADTWAGVTSTASASSSYRN